MSGRVRVKICGVTNDADARAAIALGADALGFNLFAGSKRCISLDREAAWIAALPPFVTRVAVLVNAPFEEVRRVAEHPAIDLVQLHGDEDEVFCAEFARLKRPFIKAVRVRDAASLDNLDQWSTSQILLDAHTADAYGGTGTKLDSRFAAEAVRRFAALKIILAGGLRPETVADVVRLVKPYAVDVTSGVEGRPGKKEIERMTAFFYNISKC